MSGREVKRDKAWPSAARKLRARAVWISARMSPGTTLSPTAFFHLATAPCDSARGAGISRSAQLPGLGRRRCALRRSGAAARRQAQAAAAARVPRSWWATATAWAQSGAAALHRQQGTGQLRVSRWPKRVQQRSQRVRVALLRRAAQAADAAGEGAHSLRRRIGEPKPAAPGGARRAGGCGRNARGRVASAR